MGAVHERADDLTLPTTGATPRYSPSQATTTWSTQSGADAAPEGARGAPGLAFPRYRIADPVLRRKARCRSSSKRRSGRLRYQCNAARGDCPFMPDFAQGVALPYECATGTCGTCRARLVDGEVDEGWPQAPGRQGLKPARREFLMCQAAPEDRLPHRPARPAGRLAHRSRKTL